MRVLHAGCGRDSLPAWTGFANVSRETRLDIDPDVKPDVVASITDLGEIGEYEAVWCSHALEHLLEHDGLRALQEFRRVLVKDGCCIILVPDLEDVKATDEVLYESPAGPITGRDMIYGFNPGQNPYMQHKNGFVRETLDKLMQQAGFSKVEVRRVPDYNLLGVGWK